MTVATRDRYSPHTSMWTEEHGLVRSADSGQGTWNCGVSKEEVSFHRDLVAGISVSVIDGPRVSLDPVIELRPSARLKHIKVEIEQTGTEPAGAVLCCDQEPCLAHRELSGQLIRR